ncbi:hypothetical protein OED52_20425 [Rhodococcus sp. Z13]|uniref:Uncharacterized protein n=1 Tax=Rhodococcus sacchari TaxID=2962047 RepID=A0ACD4DFW6_9NOCA|nr:hypothetical protein [Rhodococcus sp. Z13]UYP18965.1 hypothetical protein OED52_20425 [Rhodococcus sp. Z13]
MKPGARVALGVGIGYFLGRTKKMRLALMLAGAGATGKLPSSPQDLLQRSASMLGSSPEVSRITESVRGELMNAARAAAVTAASHRIDALNDRLQERAGSGTSRRSGRREEPEDVEYEDDYDEPPGERDEDYDDDTGEEDQGIQDAEVEEESEPKRPARRRTTRSTPTRTRTSRSKAKAEPDEDEDEPSPAPRKRAARATSSGRAPVRRTGR